MRMNAGEQRRLLFAQPRFDVPSLDIRQTGLKQSPITPDIVVVRLNQRGPAVHRRPPLKLGTISDAGTGQTLRHIN